MGFFTFTDAINENPKPTKKGTFKASDKITYDKNIIYVKPDNTEITSSVYEGYGMIKDKDVFVMIVEQNKDHLSDIIELMRQNEKCMFDERFTEAMLLYQQKGECQELNAITNSYAEPLMRKEWKRMVGCSMAQINELLPYPMKITKRKRHPSYDKLYPSKIIQ